LGGKRKTEEKTNKKLGRGKGRGPGFSGSQNNGLATKQKEGGSTGKKMTLELSETALKAPAAGGQKKRGGLERNEKGKDVTRGLCNRKAGAGMEGGPKGKKRVGDSFKGAG